MTAEEREREVETAQQNNDHKMLLSGIVLTAMVCVFSVSIPMLGLVFFLIIPLPVIYYRLRLGTGKTAVIVFCSLMSLFLLSGNMSEDIFFIAGMLLLGFSMGDFLEKDLTIEKIIGYACVIVFFSGTFILALYGNLSNMGLSGVISGYIDKNLKMTLSLYREMGMAEESIMMLSRSMDQIKEWLIRILPSLCMAGLLFSAWLNQLFTRKLLGNVISSYQAFNNRLNTWKAPDFLIWGVIGCILMLMLPVSFLQITGLNGLVILTLIFFFQGIAITSFYFEKKKIPPVIRGLLYGTLIFQQIFLLVIAGIGFVDVWLDFRQLGNNGENTQPPVSP